MRFKLAFLILFSTFAYGTVTVSYIYSPQCPHCIAMEPEWDRVVSRFNDSSELTFKMFNVLTPEGQEVASALGNMYVPSVYPDLMIYFIPIAVTAALGLAYTKGWLSNAHK
jgi:thiol-disulfide isomerase/thioredoxin